MKVLVSGRKEEKSKHPIVRHLDLFIPVITEGVQKMCGLENHTKFHIDQRYILLEAPSPQT